MNSNPPEARRGCVSVGLGVGLDLCALLGSDGYSTLVNGISLAAHIPYALANWPLGCAPVVLAWLRRVRPGLGTIAHPFVVGNTVDLVLLIGAPAAMPARIVLLTSGTLILAFGSRSTSAPRWARTVRAGTVRAAPGVAYVMIRSWQGPV